MKEIMAGSLAFAILWIINQIWISPVTLFAQGIFAAVLFLAVAEEFNSIKKENKQLKFRLEKQIEEIGRLKLKVERIFNKENIPEK